MVRTELESIPHGTVAKGIPTRLGLNGTHRAQRRTVRLVRLCFVGVLSFLLWLGAAAFWNDAASGKPPPSSDRAIVDKQKSEEVEQKGALNAEQRNEKAKGHLSESAALALERIEAAPDSVRSSYLIKPGDTLSGIAPSLNTSVDYLAAYNSIADPNVIYSGDTLYFEMQSAEPAKEIMVNSEGEAIEREAGGKRPDQPDDALLHRFMQDKNAKGIIPHNALVKAIEKAESMKHKSIPGSKANSHSQKAVEDSQPSSTQDSPQTTAEDDSQVTTNTVQQPSAANIEPSLWTPKGPGNIGGRIRSLVIHPTNTQIMWAGSVAGGIWKTTNGGASWQPLDDFMANLAISTLVIDPNNPNVLYAGTGEGFAYYNEHQFRGAGIFKSTDGGATWNQLPFTATSNFYFVNRLAFSPDGQVLLAATRSGIWRSTDGGASWSQRISSTDNPPAGLSQVVFDPTGGSKAIAGGNFGRAYYSTDGGLSWSAATVPWNTTSWGTRVELAYHRADPRIVYASVNQNNGLVYKSTDGGRTYSLVNTFSYHYMTHYQNPAYNQGSYDNTIWVSPTNPNVLVVGGIDLWRSTDGGQTMSKISNWQCGGWDRATEYCNGALSAHADQHAIVAHSGYNGTTNKTLFFANDGGVYKTDDVLAVGETTGWKELNNNLSITQFYSGAGNASSGTIIGGAQDNGTPVYKGDPENWSNVYEGDGGFVAADPTNSNYFYGEYVRLEIFRSTNGAASAQKIHQGITDAGVSGNALFIAPFILDPNNPNTMLAGGKSLWRSTNVKAATPSWAAIRGPDAISGNLISAIAVAQGNSDNIWLGYSKGGAIYKTSNGTSANPTWTRVDLAHMPIRYVTRVTIDPRNPNTVYATFGGYNADNIWKTTDGGSTWQEVTGTGDTGLPDSPVRSLVIHPNNSNWLYVGTEVGVFASEDGGAHWASATDGPSNVSVDELFWQGTKLVAATHGRGMFEIDTQARPANDNFANAQTLTGNNTSVGGRNVGATEETGEPNHAGNQGGKSIWYKWTAPSNGDLTIDTRGSKDTAGSMLDTTLGVYTGSTVSDLTAAAPAGASAGADDENNAGGIITSKIGPFAVTGGTTYQIAVDGYNTNGTGSVSGDTMLNLAFTSTGDNVAPTVALTAPQDGATVSGAGVNLSADATDNVGVAKVEFLVDGQVVATDTSAPYSTGWDSTTKSDGSVTVTARASDAAGNTGTSAGRSVTIDNTEPPPDLQTFEEDDPAHVGYARWSFYRNGNLSGGGSAYATSGGDTATLKFKGTKIAWKTARFPDSGKTTVFLDGKKVKTFDAYAATPQYNVTGYAKAGLPNRRHTIKLVLTGDKNVGSGGIYNDLDRFIVGSKIYQEDAPQVTYGSWRGAANPDASGGSYRLGGSVDPALFFYFTGPRIDLVTARGPSFGSATVEVVDKATDTVAKTVTLNLNAATLQWQVEHSITGLDASKTYYLRIFSADGRPVVVDSYKAIPPQGAQATAESPAVGDAKPKAPGES